MSYLYQYTLFDNFGLPSIFPEGGGGDIGTGEVREPGQRAGARMHWPYAQSVYPGGTEDIIVLKCFIRVPDYPSMQVWYKGLSQRAFTPGLLERTWIDDRRDYINARLSIPREPGQHLGGIPFSQPSPLSYYNQMITLAFQKLEPYFRSGTTTTNSVSSGVLGVPAAGSFGSNGDAPVTDAIITVPATSATSVEVKVEDPNGKYPTSHFIYTSATLGVSGVVIDCGARTVKEGAANKIENLQIGADAQTEEWIMIPPGAGGTVTVATLGESGVSVDFEYYDKWKG